MSSAVMGSMTALKSSVSRSMGTISHWQPQMMAVAPLRYASTYQSNRTTYPSNLTDEPHKKAMVQNLKRDWKTGDLYAPHDLSAAEMRKWSKKHQPTRDVFDVLSINPLTLYKNFSVMSDFISDTGRIRSARETGLRPVNQRKIAKAVRRAVALGLMPSVHKHPELLKKHLPPLKQDNRTKNYLQGTL